MNLSKIINFEIRKKGLKTVQGKAIKLLAGFLALMLLFTILSRSAYSFTTPKVTTTTISSMAIEYDMNINGEIYANRDEIICIQPNILIASVEVAEGAPVKTGDVLFCLDLNDLNEQLQIAKDQLQRLELQRTDETSSNEISAKNKKTTVERAVADYYKVLSTENGNVQKVLDELNDMESNMDAQKAKILDDHAIDIQKKQMVIKRATEDYSNTLAAANTSVQRAYDTMTAAKNKLDQYLITGTDEDIIAGLQLDYNTKKQAYDDAISNKANSLLNAQRAIEDANAIIIADFNDPLTALDTALKAKKQTYEDALTSKAGNLAIAQRAIDDANSPSAADHSSESALIDINSAKDNIEKMESLKANNGEIKTDKNGTVKKLDVIEGTRTSDGMAALLAYASSGYCFKAKVDQDMAKNISKDDAVTINLNGEDSALQNLKIDSMYVSQEDSNFFQITVNIPANSENLGSTANIEIKKPSKMYNSCVPLGALHTDGIKTYVLVVSDKKTALGSETVAERIDVVVEDKNDSYAAISSNFESDQKLIVSTNKPIKPGDRVRVEEE